MISRSLSTSLVHDASHGKHWRGFATKAFGGDLGRHRTLVLLNLTDGQLTRHVTADAMIPLALSVVEMITGSRSETPPLFTEHRTRKCGRSWPRQSRPAASSDRVGRRTFMIISLAVPP